MAKKFTYKPGAKVSFENENWVILDKAPVSPIRPEMYGAPVSPEYLRVTRNAERDYPVPRGSGACWWLQNITDPHRFVRARQSKLAPTDPEHVYTFPTGTTTLLLHRSVTGWCVIKSDRRGETAEYAVRLDRGPCLQYVKGKAAAIALADACPAFTGTLDDQGKVKDPGNIKAEILPWVKAYEPS